VSLHFERRGAGRALLLVHGLGGSTRSWDPIAPALAAARDLVVIDLPGHGRSPPVAGRQTIAAFADAIETFIGEQGLQGVDLVGSSVGARLVLELSRRGVGGHCVALDPGGFWHGWETPFFHYTLAASIRLLRVLRPLLPFLSRHALTRALLLVQLSARPASVPRDAALAELSSFVATPVFDAMLHELAIGPLQEGTATPPGRVTIGWGRNDRLLLPRQAHRAQAAFPTARLQWFEDCGHFPQWDAPQAAVRAILETCA
jgi:pimeloyl-ACP methyl ester carboxylesterase